MSGFIYSVLTNGHNKAAVVVSHNEYFHLIELFVYADHKDDFKLKPGFRTERHEKVESAAAKAEKIVNSKNRAEFHGAMSASDLCSIIRREVPASVRGVVNKAIAEVIADEIVKPTSTNTITDCDDVLPRMLVTTESVNQNWGSF